jgi:ABC-2 type transport system permease protein
MIDGFRYGFIGYADGPLAIGVIVLLVIDAVLTLMCLRAIGVGWRLKP